PDLIPPESHFPIPVAFPCLLAVFFRKLCGPGHFGKSTILFLINHRVPHYGCPHCQAICLLGRMRFSGVKARFPTYTEISPSEIPQGGISGTVCKHLTTESRTDSG